MTLVLFSSLSNLIASLFRFRASNKKIANLPTGSAHIRVLAAHASSGDSKAQVELALRYLHGDGVAKNLDVADHWFRKAARKGNPRGMLYLAYLYQQDGDYPNAELYLARAAERGNAEAMERLGLLYAGGEDFI